MVNRLRGRKTLGPGFGGRPTRHPLRTPQPWAQRGNLPNPTPTPVLTPTRLRTMGPQPLTSPICP
eukprot:8312964-Pyramimonas_sp.AAC.1